MSIIDYLKSAFSNERKKEVAEFKSRKQFNVEIEPEIANAVRNLAKMFKVPNFSAAEHLYQVGIFYVLQAIKDDEKSKLIGKHLTDRHLLDISSDSEESVIRIGEDNSNWMLLDQAESIIKCYKRFKQTIVVAEKTRSMDHLDRRKHELDVAVLRFAERIYRHRLDNSGEPPGNSEKEDKENGRNTQETGGN